MTRLRRMPQPAANEASQKARKGLCSLRCIQYSFVTFIQHLDLPLCMNEHAWKRNAVYMCDQH